MISQSHARRRREFLLEVAARDLYRGPRDGSHADAHASSPADAGHAPHPHPAAPGRESR